MPLSELGLQHSGGAGADENADAFRPVTRAGIRDVLHEPVLPQPELSQSIVPAIEIAERGHHRLVLEPLDPADPGIEIRVVEVAGAKPPSRLLECVEGCPRAPASSY